MLAIAGRYGVPPGHFAGPEPHVAESILSGWIQDAGVDVVFDAALTGAQVVDGVLTGISTAAGDYAAGVYVDASYEGDLMAAAGVPYDVGRESRAKYGESLAGRREFAPGKHQFPPFVSPLTDEGVLPFVHDRPQRSGPSANGSGAATRTTPATSSGS
jgi:hypothetical protein